MIRIRMDRHSLWHPREDAEYEADDINKALTLMAEDVEEQITRTLNDPNDTSGQLNPLALRFCESDGSTHRVRWKNVSSKWDVKVEVLITAVPASGERKRVKRRKT